MGEGKSFILYVFLFAFIGFMYVYYINPNTGSKLLVCSYEYVDKGITTNYNVKVDFVKGKFNRVDLKVMRDLTDYGYRKEEEKESLEEEISVFKEIGFIYEVFFDGPILVAEVEGTKEKLSENNIFTRKVSEVKTHYETQGYTCEVE